MIASPTLVHRHASSGRALVPSRVNANPIVRASRIARWICSSTGTWIVGCGSAWTARSKSIPDFLCRSARFRQRAVAYCGGGPLRPRRIRIAPHPHAHFGLLSAMCPVWNPCHGTRDAGERTRDAKLPISGTRTGLGRGRVRVQERRDLTGSPFVVGIVRGGGRMLIGPRRGWLPGGVGSVRGCRGAGQSQECLSHPSAVASFGCVVIHAWHWWHSAARFSGSRIDPPRARDLISCTSVLRAAWQRWHAGCASSMAITSGIRSVR